MECHKRNSHFELPASSFTQEIVDQDVPDQYDNGHNEEIIGVSEPFGFDQRIALIFLNAAEFC